MTGATTNGAGPVGPRFTTRTVDLSAMRPTRFLWRPWLVYGRLNLLVGKEKIGKSSLQAYLAAALTRGELAGHCLGKPGDVLWIATDEDDWNEVVAPRLYSLGADTDRVHEFVPVNDADVFNAVDHATELDRVLREGNYQLVVIEQLLDILPASPSPNDPSAIRAALRPLRRVLAARGVTALATLHVNKAKVTELRQHVQGSVQYGAVARSTILVAEHPHDEDRRVVVLGPANYVASVPALSFALEECRFEYDGRRFEVGRVIELEDEPDIGLRDVLVADTEPKSPPRERHHERILGLIEGVASADEPIGKPRLAKLSGLAQTTVGRILDDLAEEDAIVRTSKGVHLSCPPIGDGTADTPQQGSIFDHEEGDR